MRIIGIIRNISKSLNRQSCEKINDSILRLANEVLSQVGCKSET